MANYTRPATWEDVKRIAAYWAEEKVEYARATEDVDVLGNPSSANSRRWIGALSRLPDGAARELAVDPEPFIEEVVLDGVRLRVLSLEGLLRTKQGARPKDQADAAAIARALEQLGRG